MNNLEWLNINQNRIICIKTDVIDKLIKNDTLKNNDRLESLFINLSREEEVEYILKKLPKLKYINGLIVDREELQLESKDKEDIIQEKNQKIEMLDPNS